MPDPENPAPARETAETPASAGAADPLLSWRDGAIPVSTRFDDPYFSLAGGLAETRHVFLAGNDLPARLAPGFHVAELGFGTGLNLLALAAVTSVPLRFTSFEAFPLSRPDLARAHAAFPDLAPLAAQLRERVENQHFQLGSIEVELILGDARETLPAWAGRADAWFLDGFSPARNPELWGAPLMAEIARHTAPGGSFATYTAAGHVRRALAAAGFTVERRPGFGTKRHMTVGRLPNPEPAPANRR